LYRAQANERAQNRLPGLEMRHRQKGGKQSCDEGPDIRNVVKYESDYTPFGGEWQPCDPSKRANKESGHRAHLRSDHHIFPEFDRGRGASIQHHSRRLAVVKRLNLAADVVGLQKPEHEISKRDDPEG
jgi:hypothetical protein